ncbi:MAG TPA: hypothetical protein VHI71_05775 [Actinomycetota bacterium]|nr:hypothetical protein [Actinomycetota bacterium]
MLVDDTGSAKTAGWTVVAVAAAFWLLLAAAALGQDCNHECWRTGFSALLLATVTVTGLAAAGLLLAGGYGRGAVSTAAALTAKAGRLVAYASFLLAVASLAAMAVVGPVGGLLLIAWNLAAGQTMSLAAQRLDRNVRSEILSTGVQWIIAVAVCGTAGAVGLVAAGSVL